MQLVELTFLTSNCFSPLFIGLELAGLSICLCCSNVRVTGFRDEGQVLTEGRDGTFHSENRHHGAFASALPSSPVCTPVTANPSDKLGYTLQFISYNDSFFVLTSRRPVKITFLNAS